MFQSRPVSDAERAEPEPLVLVEREGAVAVVTMNRPRYRNAQNMAMTYALDDAFAALVADDAVKVILLAGAGDHFSAGHDIGTPERDIHRPFDARATVKWEHAERQGAEGMFVREAEAYLGMCRRWRELPKPTVAVVQGACVAGGLMLAWCCDLVVAADDAFFADPVVKMGIPGVEYFAHPYVMGPRFAKELLFTGERVGADRALAMGMINRVVPRASLREEAMKLAGKIAEMPRFGLMLTKRAVNQAEDRMGLRDTMDATFGLHHLAHAHNALSSPDHLQGQDAKSMAKGLKLAMDLELSPSERAFRDDARRWLADNVPDGRLSGDTPEGFRALRAWERLLFDARWAVVSWPEQYGGRGASAVEWLLFEEEYYRAGAPQRIAQNGIFLLAPTLFEFGSDEQKARVLPRMAAGLDVWAQGWSEPGAGSDLAGVASRGARDDARGGWRLTGQKTWCTRGAFCDYLFGLFRTDPKAERHKGLTYLMVPLDAPGVTVRPVGRLDGEPGFADVFLDDVFVPDADVIGEPHEGWTVAMTTASSERGLTLRSPGRYVAAAARLVELVRRHPGAHPSLRDAVARVHMEAEANHLYTLQTVTRVQSGEALGASASINKILWSELDVALHDAALALLGDRAELIAGAGLAEDDGAWMKGFQFALAGPIYAGTNEIQRNVIAERLLGLPRK